MKKGIERKNVKVTGGLFRDRMNLNRSYLMELEPTALLQNFYIEAGIIVPGAQILPDPDSSKLHWGWESPTGQVRGHFLGHWLSAAARLSADGDRELKAKLEYIIDELERCQKRNGGEWVGSIPEKYFDLMAEPEYIWSPQYTMHKTVMGLVDAYCFAGIEKALEIVDRLADWYVKWVKKMQDKAPDTVYKGEQGGMLEVWARLYEIKGDEKYKFLIDAYKDNGLYTQLETSHDGLSDDHANASIPLSHGAAKMYELTGEERWKNVTDLFWKTAVEDRGMYATTGSNAGEFWIPLKRHAEYLSTSDQEFCTVYNMVRTADYLYRRTGDTKYADYIERALYNGFAAQQNRFTGMPAYFLPLVSGAQKKWGSKTRDFWCCHGTMVQAQTLYPELIYYTDENSLSVMQYIPSKASVSVAGVDVNIEQTTDMKNYNNQVFFDDHEGGEKSRWSLRFVIKTSEPAEFDLALRMPVWAKGIKGFTIDGEAVEKPDVSNGCINIKRSWSDNVITVTFLSVIKLETLDDAPYLAAAVDGPVVLAGLTDADRGLKGDPEKPETMFDRRCEHTYTTYIWKQNTYVTKDQPVNFEFKPLYEITDEKYTVYFSVEER